MQVFYLFCKCLYKLKRRKNCDNETFMFQEASAVIVALFQLNTPEFTMMLSNVPNSIQVCRCIQSCKSTLLPF